MDYTKKKLNFLSPEGVRVELKFKSYSQILNYQKKKVFFEKMSKSRGGRGRVGLKFKSLSQIMNCQKKVPHMVPHMRKIMSFQKNHKFWKIQYFGINPKTVLGNDVRKLHTKFGLTPTNGSCWNHLRQVSHMHKKSKSQMSFLKMSSFEKWNILE